MTICNTFMIFYDEASKAAIPAGFTGLDNCSPADPALFEIEPMLRYLESHSIQDTQYYGFFSPRVLEKTGLSATQILDAARRISGRHDICSLAPYPGYLSGHDNLIAQGDSVHAGLHIRYDTMCQALPEAMRRSAHVYGHEFVPLRYFLMSHYLWATGAFWKRWTKIVRSVLTHEAGNPEFRALLNAPCQYPAGTREHYNYKIFLLERIAGLTAMHYRQRVTRPYLSEIWQHGLAQAGGLSPEAARLYRLKRQMHAPLDRLARRFGLR